MIKKLLLISCLFPIGIIICDYIFFFICEVQKDIQSIEKNKFLQVSTFIFPLFYPIFVIPHCISPFLKSNKKIEISILSWTIFGFILNAINLLCSIIISSLFENDDSYSYFYSILFSCLNLLISFICVNIQIFNMLKNDSLIKNLPFIFSILFFYSIVIFSVIKLLIDDMKENNTNGCSEFDDIKSLRYFGMISSVFSIIFTLPTFLLSFEKKIRLFNYISLLWNIIGFIFFIFTFCIIIFTPFHHNEGIIEIDDSVRIENELEVCFLFFEILKNKI